MRKTENSQDALGPLRGTLGRVLGCGGPVMTSRGKWCERDFFMRRGEAENRQGQGKEEHSRLKGQNSQVKKINGPCMMCVSLWPENRQGIEGGTCPMQSSAGCQDEIYSWRRGKLWEKTIKEKNISVRYHLLTSNISVLQIFWGCDEILKYSFF